MTSFSVAVARQMAGDFVPVIDPRTGETIDLAGVPHDTLVDVFLALQEREKQFKEWRVAVEDELVRRHGDRRGAQVVGDNEVDVDKSWSRVWDPVELDLVAIDLVARGVLTMADVTSLVIAQEPKVDGKKAAALLSRLTRDADQLPHDQNEALVELRRCFKWAQKGRAKVKVTPVASLEQGS